MGEEIIPKEEKQRNSMTTDMADEWKVTNKSYQKSKNMGNSMKKAYDLFLKRLDIIEEIILKEEKTKK